MSQHREIFNELLTSFGYSGREVSSWIGVSESRISRFRTGKLDLEAGEFFRLLACFPKEFQDSFWARFHSRNCRESGWRSLIMTAGYDEIEEILRLLADRWSLLQKNCKSPADRDQKDPAPLAL